MKYKEYQIFYQSNRVHYAKKTKLGYQLINLQVYLIIGIVGLLVFLCLALEMFGIIKRNYGLLVFSCVFRILQVIAMVILCILNIVAIANLSQLYNNIGYGNGYGYGNGNGYGYGYVMHAWTYACILCMHA